jgi:hypothetical protein
MKQAPLELAHRVNKSSHGGRVMKQPTHTRRHRRGAVQVEYAFLLVFVMVPAAGVLLAGGRQMYQMYLDSRSAILNSSP